MTRGGALQPWHQSSIKDLHTPLEICHLTRNMVLIKALEVHTDGRLRSLLVRISLQNKLQPWWLGLVLGLTHLCWAKDPDQSETAWSKRGTTDIVAGVPSRSSLHSTKKYIYPTQKSSVFDKRYTYGRHTIP